jgi:hypothetical protein
MPPLKLRFPRWEMELYIIVYSSGNVNFEVKLWEHFPTMPEERDKNVSLRTGPIVSCLEQVLVSSLGTF